MARYSFRKPIEDIPRAPGVYWVKGLTKAGVAKTVCANHCDDLYTAIRSADKSEWMNNDYQNYWLEIELDSEIRLTA
jgi:hypothetical protein